MRSLLLVFPFLLLFLSFNSRSQYASQVRTTPIVLRETNYLPMQYSYCMTAINETISLFFQSDTIGRDIDIIYSASPNDPPFYSVQIKPFLNKSTHDKLLAELNNNSIPSPLHIPFTERLKLQINGGSNKSRDKRGPEHVSNENHPLLDYKDQSLKTQFELIQSWIEYGVFPVLLKTISLTAELEDDVEDYLGDLANITWNVPNLADKYCVDNPLYWWALEKSKLIPSLLPCIKVFLLIHDGRFKHARNYLNLIYNSHTPPDYIKYLFEESFDRVQYYEQNEKQWAKNLYYVKLGGDSKKAVEECYDIIRINPNSTNALAYLIETQATSKMDSTFNYDFYEKELLHANPMLNYLFFVWTKENSYHQFLRKESFNFFINPESLTEDYYSYLQTAIQLNNFALSADLIHLISTNENLNSKALINLKTYYKYALNKLEKLKPIDKQNKKLHREFKHLDRKFRKQMKRHSSFKNFHP